MLTVVYLFPPASVVVVVDVAFNSIVSFRIVEPITVDIQWHVDASWARGNFNRIKYESYQAHSHTQQSHRFLSKYSIQSFTAKHMFNVKIVHFKNQSIEWNCSDAKIGCKICIPTMCHVITVTEVDPIKTNRFKEKPFLIKGQFESSKKLVQKNYLTSWARERAKVFKWTSPVEFLLSPCIKFITVVRVFSPGKWIVIFVFILSFQRSRPSIDLFYPHASHVATEIQRHNV